jgi:hypothetical protein
MKKMLTIGALSMALAFTVGCKKKDENAAGSGSASASAGKVEDKPADKPADPPADKPADPPAGDTVSTGSPECDEYLKTFDDMATKCKDKLGPAFDAMKQARDAQADAFKQWADLDEASKKAALDAAATGCKSATDALKQSASAMGCTL